MGAPAMMKIVCAGWRCPDWIRTTLDSIAIQHHLDFEVMITYESDDPTERGFDIIENWIRQQSDNGKYHTMFRHGAGEMLYGSRARYDAINAMAPADDDIIVWLNIDGDRFAHPQVLNRVWDAYFVDGFPLVTYGSFVHVPLIPQPLESKPYDNAVIMNRTFRQAPFCAADLRTMMGKVWCSLPASEQQWSGGRGWYSKCDDVSTMIPALERVGIRHRFIPEVLMVYNTLNPFSAMKAPGDSEATTEHLADIGSKPCLELMF